MTTELETGTGVVWTQFSSVAQSCPTLCDRADSSPPGSPVPGILQARILEWVAISFSNAWKWKVKVKSLSRVPLSAISWTAAYQAPLSMGFSRHEYWNGVPLPSPKTWWGNTNRLEGQSLKSMKLCNRSNSKIINQNNNAITFLVNEEYLSKYRIYLKK